MASAVTNNSLSHYERLFLTTKPTRTCRRRSQEEKPTANDHPGPCGAICSQSGVQTSRVAPTSVLVPVSAPQPWAIRSSEIRLPKLQT